MPSAQWNEIDENVVPAGLDQLLPGRRSRRAEIEEVSGVALPHDWKADGRGQAGKIPVNNALSVGSVACEVCAGAQTTRGGISRPASTRAEYRIAKAQAHQSPP